MEHPAVCSLPAKVANNMSSCFLPRRHCNSLLCGVSDGIVQKLHWSSTPLHALSPVPDDGSLPACTAPVALFSDECSAKLHAWCTSRCLVWHWYI